jgi:rhodanese-related sulfurtransferase
MNQFIKSNKPWLSLLGLAIIIVFLAFLFRPKSPEYHTGTEQAVKMMIYRQNQVVISDLAGKQLIDIRSVDLYEQGHPENAINIPVRNLLDKESLELFDRLLKSGQVAALYGSDELQAVAPCLLLQQMGYTNLKTLKGGFVATNEFKESALSTSEVMLLDTATMKSKQEMKVIETETKKPQVVVPVRKGASAGGGC